MANSAYGWATPTNPVRAARITTNQMPSVGTPPTAPYTSGGQNASQAGQFQKVPDIPAQSIAAPGFGVGQFANKDARDQNKSYLENMYFPQAQLDINRSQLDLERAGLGNTFRNDATTRELSVRGANREDAAFDFSKQQWGSEFGEKTRQFDVTSGIEQGRLKNEVYGNETERMLGQAQNAVAQQEAAIKDYEARTGRMDVEGRQRLEQYQNETNRLQVQNTNTNTQFANNTQRMAVEAQTAIDNEKNRIAQYEAQTGRQDVEGRQRLQDYENQTSRLRATNEMALGQGRLNLDTQVQTGQLTLAQQQQRLDEAFRYQQLQQQQQIAAMQTFGRNRMPNTQWLRSW